MRYICILLWLAGCAIEVALFFGAIVILLMAGMGDGGWAYPLGGLLLGASILWAGVLWSLWNKLFPDRWPNS